MSKKPHHLREWRERAGLTQQELADLAHTSKSQISALERFENRMTTDWLERLAPALGVQSGYIIDYDPDDLPDDIVGIWSRIPRKDRPQAARVLRSFMHTGDPDDEGNDEAA